MTDNRADDIDSGKALNWGSLLPCTPLLHLPLAPGAGSFSIGPFSFQLDEWTDASGACPVKVDFSNKRVRLRLIVDGTRLLSVIMGGGFNNTAIYQSPTEFQAGIDLGTPSVPNLADTALLTVHQNLSAVLPTAHSVYKSRVSLGAIGPHYDKKAAHKGARLSPVLWPKSAGELLVPSAITLMVESFNALVAFGTAWKTQGYTLSGGLLLPQTTPLITLASSLVTAD